MGGKRSPVFGMHTPPSPWKATLAPGAAGKLVVFFDPNAHGPQGVGSVERGVSLATNELASSPYIVRITGVVVD